MGHRKDNEFWSKKALADMTTEEWELVCDGCARCCVCKLEDADTGLVHYTDVSCRFLDTDTCRCTDYSQRTRNVPDCVKLEPGNLSELAWMPDTCAYRLLHEGKPLESWHPLVSGDPDSVHEAGVSIRGRTVSEEFVHEDDLRERVIHWNLGSAKANDRG
jgi:uncharacterized cysteine cluster protein YcgN (CxxCxxCC family)